MRSSKSVRVVATALVAVLFLGSTAACQKGPKSSKRCGAADQGSVSVAQIVS